MTIANSFRGKRGKRPKFADFLLKWGRKEPINDGGEEFDP